MLRGNKAAGVLLSAMGRAKALTALVALTVAGAAALALAPPLVLEKIIDLLAGGQAVPFALALMYFGLTALAGLTESARESLLTLFGQRAAHALRSALCEKLSRLPARAFVSQESGATASRFMGDVDAVESLFTAGIVGMFADALKLIGIFAVIFIKNRGLALVLVALTPPLFCFTRFVRRRVFEAQTANRAAVARETGHVPETIHCIRTVRLLGKERYMLDKYDRYIGQSYRAVEKTNFFDAIYSPVILTVNAAVVAAVMLLSATGDARIGSFFGMSAGTAVAMIAYISQVFSPLESIGMEIQVIQGAMAGLRRVNQFLDQPERWETREALGPEALIGREIAIELRGVTFGYDAEQLVLENVSFTVRRGEQATLIGRTGCGKTTVFKLLLGLYRPQSGQVLVNGQDASLLPDSVKRRLFGCVEQSFRRTPGTVRDQIALFDETISPAASERAARLVGLHEAISRLPQGYDTPCAPVLFSQGQWQLLSIARAVAGEPQILLLDEITANLDADTEETVLRALREACANRTILSISHRLYDAAGGRRITLTPSSQNSKKCRDNCP